jgi:hypothetical protein
MESAYFCEFGSHANFHNPTINPYWGLATAVPTTTRKQQENKKKNKYAK